MKISPIPMKWSIKAAICPCGRPVFLHLPVWSVAATPSAAQELSSLVPPRLASGLAPALGHVPPRNAARQLCLSRRPCWAQPRASDAVRGAHPPTQVHRGTSLRQQRQR